MRQLLVVIPALLLLWATPLLAGQQIISKRVDKPPVIDGNGNDPDWSQSVAVVTRDLVTEKEITLQSIHTADEVFFLVQYLDDKEERQHKTLIWNEALEMYKAGPEREDSFVFKWNMEAEPVDLTLSGNRPYQADIWYWKAARTDYAGYADDKIQVYSLHKQKKTKQLLSKSGRLFYLRRSGDEGKSAYETIFQDEFVSKRVPRFKFRKPEGSRADIRAKGEWKAGVWTIEFARKLKTGNNDDISLDLHGNYQFGVSIYEVAGRERDPKSIKPLFGSGEVGEELTLIFK